MALAFARAYLMSSSVAYVFPYLKLSLIVPIMRTGSYDTYPIDSLSASSYMSLIFFPSNKIFPYRGS